MPAPLALGRVIEVQRGRWLLATAPSTETPTNRPWPWGQTWAVLSGAFAYGRTGPEDDPLLGDWVAHEPVADGPALIQRVLPRRGVLRRRAPGREAESQSLAAQVDLGVIVMGLDGDFNPRRAERYLTLLAAADIPALLYLSKADLDPERAAAEVAGLRQRWPGMPVVAGSALPGTDLAGGGLPGPAKVLAPWLLPGRTLCLLGRSGAGKSTLFNALLGTEPGWDEPPGLRRATGAVRADDQRGRHTSSDRVLRPGLNGVLLMDHPGLREVGLWAGRDSLDAAFADITALAASCRFRDCRHEEEPGCAVQAALTEGRLDPDQWLSWQRQEREIRYLERRVDPNAAQAERDRWKQINKSMRGFNKERRAGGSYE